MCVRQHLQYILILTTWGKHLRPEPEIELGCHQIAYTSITAPTSPSAQPGLLEDTEATLLTTSQDGLHLPLASTDRGQTVRRSANGSSITRPEGQKMQKFHRAIPLTLRLTEPQLEVSWHLEIRIFITGYRTSFNKRRRKFGNSLVNVEANHEEGDSSEVPICSSKLTSVRKQNKVTSGWIWCDYWGRKKKKI